MGRFWEQWSSRLSALVQGPIGPGRRLRMEAADREGDASIRWPHLHRDTRHPADLRGRWCPQAPRGVRRFESWRGRGRGSRSCLTRCCWRGVWCMSQHRRRLRDPPVRSGPSLAKSAPVLGPQVDQPGGKTDHKCLSTYESRKVLVWPISSHGPTDGSMSNACLGFKIRTTWLRLFQARSDVRALP